MNRSIKALRAFFKTESQLKTEERRELLKQLGPDFMKWAEETFIPGNQSMIKQAKHLTLFNDFIDKNPDSRRYITSSGFLRRLKLFCQFNGLQLISGYLNGTQHIIIGKS